MLPPAFDGSHHLVPKTGAQQCATKTLLHKVFEMTGKRRDIINLNGSGGRPAATLAVLCALCRMRSDIRPGVPRSMTRRQAGCRRRRQPLSSRTAVSTACASVRAACDAAHVTLATRHCTDGCTLAH
jgi:hypothetical protein